MSIFLEFRTLVQFIPIVIIKKSEYYIISILSSLFHSSSNHQNKWISLHAHYIITHTMIEWRIFVGKRKKKRNVILHLQHEHWNISLLNLLRLNYQVNIPEIHVFITTDFTYSRFIFFFVKFSNPSDQILNQSWNLKLILIIFLFHFSWLGSKKKHVTVSCDSYVFYSVEYFSEQYWINKQKPSFFVWCSAWLFSLVLFSVQLLKFTTAAYHHITLWFTGWITSLANLFN